jgi:predicted ATPase
MVPHIREVRIRNYKSIAQIQTSLDCFTVLVGPNGSGKSNFVDSLAFVQECLSQSVELAFKNRGGIASVRRRSGGHPTHIAMGLTLELGQGVAADYAFKVAAKPAEQFRIATERCVVRRLMGETHEFVLENGKFTKEIPGIRPKVHADRLGLFAASATDEFRPVFDFLTDMRFYSIVPNRLRDLRDPDPGAFLKRDGSNAAAVLKRLSDQENGGGKYERLCSLLAKAVKGLEKVEHRAIGQKETLQFRQNVGLHHPGRFEALNMSDGTLRILGLLLALYQPGSHSVVAVEEPEATVHPGIMEMVLEVLLDASRERQVLVTTHSPDVLDHKDLDDRHIRVVTIEQNRTLVCPLSETSRRAVRDRLYTAGELLRSDELTPDVAGARQAAQQMSLFGSPGASRTSGDGASDSSDR